MAPAFVSAQPPFAVRFTQDATGTGKVHVEVFGLSRTTLQQLRRSNWKTAQWQRLLSIYAGSSGSTSDRNLPAVLGAYRIDTDVLRFEPQFPLESGVSYQALFRPDRLPGKAAAWSAPVIAVYQLPQRSATAETVVSQVYPSADVVPENLLKFYIHFSAPMSRGGIYDHIHLRDHTGKEIELPFLEVGEELWDPAMTRLTLFIDPGRIKRGVLPLEEIGPSLEAGKTYALIVSREWRDGAGKPLKTDFQKIFRVGPADRNPPDPSQWRIQPPQSETRDPLVVAFPDPMDHALARRMIQVVSEAGELLGGEIIMEDQERRWTFLPAGPWTRGRYHLVIQTTIEDLAGNNIGKPFEVDLFDDVQRRLTASSVKLSFEVR